MRRRTGWRYMATDPSGKRTPLTVRAYVREDAEDYARRRGYTDLVRAEIARPSGQWAKNERAIREAIEFLGIQQPVTIKLTGRRGDQKGAWRLDLRGGRARVKGGKWHEAGTATSIGHRITVKDWLTPEEAGRTLWHELTHAMQAERIIAAAGVDTPLEALRACLASDERGPGLTYHAKPVEVEAREYEDFNDEMPLAVPA